MSTFLASTWLIASTHFVRLLSSRRAIFCFVLALLPALVAFIVAMLSQRATPAFLAVNISWKLLLQTIVPLVTLIAGSAVVAEEVEDRTITYLFTRPIPRASLLFGRYASTLLFLGATFALGTFLLLLAADNAHGTGIFSSRGNANPWPFEIDTGIRAPLYAAVLCGVVVYSALFATLGAFFKQPILVGLGYAFAIEGFLANLPGKNQTLTIQYHLRSVIAEHGSKVWQRMPGFRSTEFESTERACAVLGVLTLLLLGLGAWRLSRRQFELTS
jgi:ABC-2 type transport system permease protein